VNLDNTTIIGAAAAIAGIGGTWALLGHRVRALEGSVKEIRELRKQADAIDDKIETLRKDQGGRLGKLETKADDIHGQFEGFKYGLAAGRRSKTAAAGQPVVKEGEA
jgi:hypothetical protein